MTDSFMYSAAMIGPMVDGCWLGMQVRFMQNITSQLGAAGCQSLWQL